MNCPSLVEIPFHGDNIAAISGPTGRPYVVIKRICENIGVDLSSQLQKLKATPWAGVAIITTPDERGRPQEHAVIAIDRLPMWMATLNPGKVVPALRDKIERYQVEAADVLARHFTPEVVSHNRDPIIASAETIIEVRQRQLEQERVLAEHHGRLTHVENQAVTAGHRMTFIEARAGGLQVAIDRTKDEITRIRAHMLRHPQPFFPGGPQSLGNRAKRQALSELLSDGQFRDFSDGSIANSLGIDPKTVAAFRRRMGISADPDTRIVVRAGQSYRARMPKREKVGSK